jgi:hypothetical protein
MTENVTKKWLSEEIKFFIILGTMLTSIILGYSSLERKLAVQQEIVDNIRGNHLVHIQTSLEENSKQHLEIEKKIERILTILERK